MTTENSCVVDVQEHEDGSFFIELPQEMMDKVGWTAGDVVVWNDNKDGTYTLTKKDTQWVLVETVQTFRHRYMVQVPTGKSEWALDTVVCEEAKEFSQKHLDETIVSHRVVSYQEALNLCDEDNDYCRGWAEELKVKTFFQSLEDEE